MNTIGQMLKEARVKKNISLIKLENLTKIKRDFILKLEKNDWDNLPEFPVVSGFVKNLASFLKINRTRALALLRRDYPPRKQELVIEPIAMKVFLSAESQQQSLCQTSGQD